MSLHNTHIAFFVLPAHGHINPTLETVEALVKTGYRVTYATSEAFAPVLRDIGADVVYYKGGPSSEGVREALRIRRFIKHDIPALVIYDDLDRWGTWFAKEMPHVPTIRFFVGFASTVGGGFWGDHHDGLQPLFNKSNSKPDSLSNYIYNHVCRCNLVFIPRFFQMHADTFDERFHFLGPSISHRRAYGRWDSTNNERDIILISLGTVLNARPDFYRICMDGLSELDFRIIMSVGDGVDIDTLRPIPANFEIRRFVPIVDILPHSVVFIGHGGMNSTMEALYHGVPLILAPQDRYHYLIATRVAELGLGTVLPHNFDGQTLIDSIRSTLNDSAALRRVSEVGVEMRKSRAAETAVEIIEKHLHLEGGG